MSDRPSEAPESPKWASASQLQGFRERRSEDSNNITKHSGRRPSEENSSYERRTLDEQKSSGHRPSETRSPLASPPIRQFEKESSSKFDYSRFCSSLKNMHFNPLFAQESGSEPIFIPDRDMSAYSVMLEDCLQDSRAFNILPWNIYEEKKDSVIKIRSQVQKIQNVLVNSPSEADTTLMILTLYTFRELELLILRNVSAVLAYQVISSESSVKDIDSELSSTKFLLKDKENLIEKLEYKAREKDDKISQLEERIKAKERFVSDSDTDVEDEGASKKKLNSSFSISDSDVLELASILRSLDSSLPYPTPSNLLTSLSKLKSITSAYSNVQKSDKNDYKEKYHNLEKKYNSSKDKLEKYREDASMWRERYEESKSRKEPHNDNSNENNEKYAKELRELKATLRREHEAEISSVSEQADREMNEMQESFNARLREAENGFRKQIDDLKKKLDSKQGELRSSKLENSEYVRKNQSIANSQLDKMQKEFEAQYEDQIADLEKRLENAGLEASKTLEKELEKLREGYELEITSLSRRHKKEVDKAVQDGILSKIDLQNLLDDAQSKIESIKEEAFKDKEETDREINSLTRKMNELTEENYLLTSAVQQAESKYSNRIEGLDSRVSELEKENLNLKEQISVEKNNSETLKQDIRDKEVYIGELGNSVLEYQKLTKEFDSVEDRYKAELQKKDAHITSLEVTIQKEKEKANQGLVDVREAREEAVDQLDRVKRRLKATEQDLARSKSFAEEKESEILDLKRLIRSQNKQLQHALGGSEISTPKISKDDLESKIEILNTQVTSLKRQLEYKEKESFEVRMEAAEAFQKASDLDKAREEINNLNSEMDKISLTMIELKSAKVQLLERVDNAEHRETLLKNELSLLKAELERNR